MRVAFKRVAVDTVGPISPPSEAGHRYFLTVVDYATRYPEAVPLKKINTEAVAEALLDIYSRVGIPEEVLTDQETQFMSECMQEVSRLLSIKGLTSTPYHSICNGLVESWNKNIQVNAREALPSPAKVVAQTDEPCFVSVVLRTFSQRTWNDLEGIVD